MIYTAAVTWTLPIMPLMPVIDSKNGSFCERLSFSTRTAACAFELILGIGWVAETGRLGELTTYRNRLSIVLERLFPRMVMGHHEPTKAYRN
jgi:hypothetical protein